MAVNHYIAVCVVIGILGSAAASLAFSAENTKIKVSDIVITSFGCNYPSTPANILGYTAAACLLLTEIIISSVTRCVCCQKTSSNPQSTGAIITFVISWVATVVGIGLLVSAANLSTRHELLDVSGICYTVKPGIFAVGGVMAIIASGTGISTISLIARRNYCQPAPASIPHQGGIAMGNPQYDNASTNLYPKQQQCV